METGLYVCDCAFAWLLMLIVRDRGPVEIGNDRVCDCLLVSADGRFKYVESRTCSPNFWNRITL